MNTFYRNVNNDDAFKVDRFSGFVELQKAGVNDSWRVSRSDIGCT